MAKAKQRFSWDRIASDGVAIKIDGSTNETIQITLSDFPQGIQDEISVYGLSKIVDDRLSQVPADMKMSQVEGLVNQLMAGDWKAERTGGIRFLPAVIEAIKQAKGCTIAAAQDAYRELDDEQRIVLKTNLADQILKIEEARKEAAAVDLEDLLS